MADPKDEITTQDILAQYGPTPQAKPKDEHGFLFSNVGGELKFNPWESIKNFMSYRAPPGALSTSGDSKPVEHAFEAAGWPALPGLGLNAYGAMTPGGLRAAQSVLTSAGARVPKAAPAVERELDPLGFYSAALEGAKTWPMERGSPSQALAHLKKSGTKDAEIAATGLDKYLAEQDVVTRQALENYLRENRVKLERDVYGGNETAQERWLEKAREREVESTLKEYDVYADPEDGLYRHYLYGEPTSDRAWKSPVAAENALREEIEDGIRGMSDAELRERWFGEGTKAEERLWPSDVKGPTKWHEYTGDESNPAIRESVVRLKMPEKLNALERERKNQLALRQRYDSQALSFEHGSSEAERFRDLAREANEKYLDLSKQITEIDSKFMQDGHFDGPGVISHSQLAMQPDIEGRNWLTPWQVQSDWGQSIRTSQHDAASRDLFQKPFKQLTQDERAEVTKALRNDPNKYPPGRNEQKIAEIKERANAANAHLQSSIHAGHQYLQDILPDGASLEPMSAHGTAKYLMAKGHEFLKAGDVDNARRAFELETAIHEAQKAYNLVEPELRTAIRTAPAHPMVNTTDQWVTTQLRNVLQHAAKEDAHGVALPRGETVLTYNPGDEHGMAGFYDNILQRAMAKEMKRLDPSIKGPEEVRLLPHDEEFPLAYSRRSNGNNNLTDNDLRALHESDFERTAFKRPFYGFPLTEKAKEEIRKGLPLFSMPGIPVADLLRAYYGDEKE